MEPGDQAGFRMPAEWERHEATWFSWPKNETTFPGKALEKVRLSYIDMIEALASGEKVNVLVDDEKSEREASSRLKSSDNVVFFQAKTEDVWIRDYGPIFVRDSVGLIKATKWIFNAWGEKYDDLLADNFNGKIVAKLARVETIEPGMVLEGGSIDVNGSGTLLTTKQCLLNRNRNPSLSEIEIQGYLRRFLWAESVIWLGGGIEGDDTDGHVDDVARFAADSKVLCAVEEQDSPNRQVLEANFKALQQSKTSEGQGLEVIPLEMPKKAVKDDEGYRLPASYANFYIGNDAVLVPLYDDANDGKALEVIAQSFPGRETIGIDCRALVMGFGSIHCVTQQQPAIDSNTT